MKEEQKAKWELEKELWKKEKASAQVAALLVLSKKENVIGGGARGRLIPHSDRQKAVELIKQAVENGATLERACEILDISVRTHQRSVKNGEVKKDGRPEAERNIPFYKLTIFERELILKTVKEAEFIDLPTLSNRS